MSLGEFKQEVRIFECRRYVHAISVPANFGFLALSSDVVQIVSDLSDKMEPARQRKCESWLANWSRQRETL